MIGSSRTRPPLPCILLPLVLVACSGGGDPDPGLTGGATFTVTGGPTGDEDVSLSIVGWSEIAEDAGGVLTATDDSGVQELMIVVDEAVEGEQVPRLLRYRRGLNVLLDHNATDCTVTLRATKDPDQPWSGDFACAEMVAEDPEGSRDGWGIAGGSFSGGEARYLTVRNEAFQATGWSFGPRLSGPEDTEPVTAEDPDRAIVIPWRGDAVWVLLEDGGETGGTDTTDDVLLKFEPDVNELRVNKWIRAGAREDVALSLDVSSTEGLEFTAAVAQTGAEATGESVNVELWAGLQDDPEDLTVRIN